MTPKKVFVSGCFDLLHSGHVEFFQRAAEFGHLYVAIGSDLTLQELKGRAPVNTQEERLFMVRALRCVHEAFISTGSGVLDFAAELAALRPDILVTNEDGNTPDKRRLAESLGVEYVVLRREPHAGLPGRSTTALRALDQLPYRIDLAGGWLDQPYVSRHHPGSVITLSIEPTIEFNDRSGMATSTRRRAQRLWGTRLPPGDPHELAELLFCYDNPPGTKWVSGAQDTIGIVYPGLARSHYAGEYWPTHIDHECGEDLLRFVESRLYLLPLGPRYAEYDPLSDTDITPAGARRLADAAEACWDAILACDAPAFGAAMTASFEAQIAMFPHMVSENILELIAQYRDRALGWKLSGAGGGGYVVLASEQAIESALGVVARREWA